MNGDNANFGMKEIKWYVQCQYVIAENFLEIIPFQKLTIYQPSWTIFPFISLSRKAC